MEICLLSCFTQRAPLGKGISYWSTFPPLPALSHFRWCRLRPCTFFLQEVEIIGLQLWIFSPRSQNNHICALCDVLLCTFVSLWSLALCSPFKLNFIRRFERFCCSVGCLLGWDMASSVNTSSSLLLDLWVWGMYLPAQDGLMNFSATCVTGLSEFSVNQRGMILRWILFSEYF